MKIIIQGVIILVASFSLAYIGALLENTNGLQIWFVFSSIITMVLGLVVLIIGLFDYNS